MFIKCFIAFLRSLSTLHQIKVLSIIVFMISFAYISVTGCVSCTVLCKRENRGGWAWFLVFIVFSSAHENQIMMSQKDLQTLRLSLDSKQRARKISCDRESHTRTKGIKSHFHIKRNLPPCVRLHINRSASTQLKRSSNRRKKNRADFDLTDGWLGRWFWLFSCSLVFSYSCEESMNQQWCESRSCDNRSDDVRRMF